MDVAQLHLFNNHVLLLDYMHFTSLLEEVS